METIYDRTEDLGEYIPEPDDDRIICRCEEVTKGEIRKAVHDGMYTITEIRRYLRCGMGLCQGQTCAKLVKGIVARELGVAFYTGEEVVELRKIKGKIRQVVTAKHVFEGEKVIVAAGYVSRKILGTVGIDVPMSNDLIEALVTEAEPKMFAQMLGTADADFYGHQTDHGSFVFGGASGMETVNNEDAGI